MNDLPDLFMRCTETDINRCFISRVVVTELWSWQSLDQGEQYKLESVKLRWSRRVFASCGVRYHCGSSITVAVGEQEEIARAKIYHWEQTPTTLATSPCIRTPRGPW